MGLLRSLWSPTGSHGKPTVITFTGGMGAQVISAAIYFSMKQAGQKVYADLSYFDQPEKVVQAGNAGQCSHWAWQLDLFGLSPTIFATDADLDKRSVNLLEDGPEKLKLGLEALAQPAIREHFKVPAGLEDVLSGWEAERYLCVHVRRGDYVNVASHLVGDAEFIAMARRFSRLVDGVVVLSDSPLGSEFRQAISASFKRAQFLDQADVATAHRVMRKAGVLICSNSQFSLIGAALNPDALAIIPKQWFAGDDRAIEAPIHARCEFQILGADAA